MRSFIFFVLFCCASFSAAAQEAAPPTHETKYWHVQLFMRLNSSDFERQASVFLPTSDGIQEVLQIRKYSPGYRSTELVTDGNIYSTWTSNPGSKLPNWIIFDAQIKIHSDIQPKRFETSTYPGGLPPQLALSNEELKLLSDKIRELGLTSKSVNKKIKALFDFVTTSVETIPEDDAKKKQGLKPLHKIFEDNQATPSEKIRLYRAFLTNLLIPNRLVTGLYLKDRRITSKTHTWIQAWLNGRWIDFDPTKSVFAMRPQSRLVLFSGEGNAFSVGANLEHKTQFVIHRLSEESAMDPGDLVIPQKDLVVDELFKKDVTESEVKDAVGRIAIITESPIPNSVIDKISKAAAKSRTKVYFYSAPYESHFFRGSYIAKILTQNYALLRQVDAIYIQSEDDAGLYALFRMAQNNKRLKSTTLFLNGKISESVGDILGFSLYKLIKPKDLFILPDSIGIERAWDILEDNVLNGLPMHDVSQHWNLTYQDLSKKDLSSISAWRQFLIKTWTKAAAAEVNLESIYLVLILPIIALVIVVFRNVIGLETFGTFTPVIISVAFLTTGLFWGIAIFALIVATGVLFRLLFRRIYIHMVARMAMLIAVVGLTMMTTIIVGVHFGWGALVNVSILPMVIMAGTIENFTKTQMELGTREALRLTVTTLVVSALSYYIIDVAGVQSLVLVYPELTLIALFFEILIGRWNGIRLLEYRRFFKIVGPSEGDEKSWENERHESRT